MMFYCDNLYTSSSCRTGYHYKINVDIYFLIKQDIYQPAAREARSQLFPRWL